MYFLRHGRDEAWETLVHRRSAKVSFSKRQLATPGGLVDRSDCVNENWVMNKEHGFFNAMIREVSEETGIDLNRVQHKIIGKENMNNKLFYIYKLENQIINLEPEDNNEIEGIQWMDICEIENFINNYDCNRSLRELNKRKTRIKKKLNKHINYYNPNQMMEIVGKV